MKTIEAKDLKIAGEHYATLDEFYKCNENRGLGPLYSRDCSGRQRREEAKPGHDVSWEETREHALFGSDLFDGEFEKVRSEVEGEIGDYMKAYRRARQEASVIGQSVNVGRSLMGHPKAFRRRRQQPMKRKTVEFVFNNGCNYSVDTETRMKAGVIMLVIAETMERMGYQTAITLAPECNIKDSNRGGTQIALCEIELKNFSSRFNLKKLQFPIASRSMKFHVGHWFVHRLPTLEKNLGDGEGNNVDYNGEAQGRMLEYCRRNGKVYLSVLTAESRGLDVNRCFEYVMEQVESMSA